jgi:hypothetical protein
LASCPFLFTALIHNQQPHRTTSTDLHGTPSCETVKDAPVPGPVMTMVLDRAAPTLGSTRNPMVRVPLPLESPVNVIHDAVLTALHEQSLRVATTKELLSPDAGKEVLAGVTSYVQGNGAASNCVTVKVWPAIVSVPVRTVVPLSVALNPTEPLPVPLAPDVTVSHDALLVALHG